MTIDLPRTALLGVGSMSGSVLDGLLAAGLDPATVTLTTKSEGSAAAHRQRGLDATASDTDPDANRRAVRGAALVVVGVKPYMIADLLDEVAADLEPGAVLVSVAVGTTTASMESRVPAGVRVVRALPNTPIGVGHGVTGVSAGASADSDAVALASSVFTASGQVIEVPETQLDALSAVSGSGPAYVFLLVEEWQRAAEALGFTPDQAATMVQGTLRGAVELLDRSDREPADLADTFLRASRAAIARAEEIAAS